MRYIIALTLSLLMAGAALASHCPSLIHEIDERLATMEVDDTTRSQVMTLRNEGESLHQQGNHSESVRVLEQALEQLDAAAK